MTASALPTTTRQRRTEVDSRPISNDDILALFQGTNAPLSPGAIEAQLRKAGFKFTRRTLNRNLETLTARGELTASGTTRNRVYALPRGAPGFTPSPEGQRALAYVRQPLAVRPPSAYERDFLESYRPNVTSYLSATLRTKLARAGSVLPGTAPAGTYARNILDRFLIDLSWASSQLEGNTYTLLDTETLVNSKAEAFGKSPAETTMILNHKAAIEWLVEHSEQARFDAATIKTLHAFLGDGLMEYPQDAGQLRDRPVFIGQTRYLPPSRRIKIEPLFATVLDKAQTIEDPFEQAFFVLVQLPYLQPFADVNKRTSRLAANIPFIRDNLCPLSFVDCPKSDYISALLAVYEIQDVTLLRDVFEYTYLRSTERYPLVQATVDEPDPIEFRYRDLLKATVYNIVAAEAIEPDIVIARSQEEVELPLREAFAERVKLHLSALHEFSLARYHLTPDQFSKWQVALSNAGD